MFNKSRLALLPRRTRRCLTRRMKGSPFVGVRFPESELRRLDALARRLDVDRSKAIRLAVERLAAAHSVSLAGQETADKPRSR